MKTLIAAGRGHNAWLPRLHSRNVPLMKRSARLTRYVLWHAHAVFLAGIGATLAMAAVGAYADSIKIGGTGTGLGTMKLMAREFNKSRPDAQLIVTPSLGSTGAIRAVLAGAVDIGISARPLTPEENRQGASARA
ncbi:MAG: substrate-binding domain-containing protein, partial [Burkholderiales bacterium]